MNSNRFFSFASSKNMSIDTFDNQTDKCAKVGSTDAFKKTKTTKKHFLVTKFTEYFFWIYIKTFISFGY